jgi:cytochrome bd-type quinol oxidase subunit 2
MSLLYGASITSMPAPQSITVQSTGSNDLTKTILIIGGVIVAGVVVYNIYQYYQGLNHLNIKRAS